MLIKPGAIVNKSLHTLGIQIVGIDVAGNVTEIMEPFLEPSLGRYNLFSSYHKSTMEALESLESGKDKRDLPEEYARRVPGPPSHQTGQDQATSG